MVFDAAYAAYIQDKDIPRSIYDVPGAEEVAIEVNSFSKVAGFTGVRLGWTVIPKAMKWTNGSVHADFSRIMSTVFNGASNIAQAGGLACLAPEGLAAIDEITNYYMKNAVLLHATFSKLGFEVCQLQFLISTLYRFYSHYILISDFSLSKRALCVVGDQRRFF